MAEYTLFSSGSYYIKANNKPIARLNTGVKISSSLTIYHSVGCVVNNVNINGTPNLEYCFTFIFDGATQLQINMPGLSGTYNASNDKNATNYKWFDCESGAANIVLNNCETDDNIYLFYSDNGMEFDEYHWLYTDFRKMRIPMTATIFTGTGPLAYSDEDYAYTYNPENYSSFAITFKEDAVKNEGGTLPWMSVQLTGENNIKTTTISGNWTSIINGGSGYPYEDGVTLVLDEIGTDLHPILKKINDDEINEYVIFDTPYLYVKINKDSNGYLKSYIKSPYEPSGSSKYITLTNISNNNPVYICYYFNAMMASKYGQSSNSPIEAMFFVEVDGQNKYIAGSIVMNQSINLTDHTYYKDFFVNSLPEFSILIEDNKKYSNEWINITDLPNPLLVGKNYNDEYFKSGDFLTSSTIYGLILNGIFVTNYLPASLFNINGEIWIYGNNQCGIKMWYESSGGYIQIAVYYNGNIIVTPGGSDGVIYAKKTQLISGDAKISLFCGIKEDRQRGSMFAIIRTGTINSFSYEMQWVSWFSRDLYNFLTTTPTPVPSVYIFKDGQFTNAVKSGFDITDYVADNNNNINNLASYFGTNKGLVSRSASNCGSLQISDNCIKKTADGSVYLVLNYFIPINRIENIKKIIIEYKVTNASSGAEKIVYYGFGTVSNNQMSGNQKAIRGSFPSDFASDEYEIELEHAEYIILSMAGYPDALFKSIQVVYEA